MSRKIFTTICLIISLLFQSAFIFPAKHADDIKLKAVLVSDIHTDGNPIDERCDVQRKVFCNIGKTQNDADTIVMSGDLTNCGDEKEYFHLLNFLNLYCKIRNRVPEMGNHDSWHHSDDPDYEIAEKNFLQFCKRCGVKTDKVYFSKEVKGYTFISTGVEDADFGNSYLSEEQLEWIDSELERACGEGRPVFFICHKPIYSMGDVRGKLSEILYKNAENASAPIIYISGHWHELGADTFFVPRENLIYLNLPSLLHTDDGGLGFTAEVYDKKVVLTGMDFLKNEALDGFTYTLEF
ncbi:MAG: metallophosphoesterase [Clostridiales bacterium]|nr:metallophosphoesterase [Clostridiales bacterium]